jgi:hypothetical protein
MLRDLPGQRLDVDTFEQARAAEGAVDFDGAFDDGLADLVLGHGCSPLLFLSTQSRKDSLSFPALPVSVGKISREFHEKAANL